MPRSGPNLGKTARVIIVMLRCTLRSLCNALFPLAEPQGANGPICDRVFP